MTSPSVSLFQPDAVCLRNAVPLPTAGAYIWTTAQPLAQAYDLSFQLIEFNCGLATASALVSAVGLHVLVARYALMAVMMSPCQRASVVSVRCQHVTGGAGAFRERLWEYQPVSLTGIDPQFTVVLFAPGPACSAPCRASARADATGTTISPSLPETYVWPKRLVVSVMFPAIASTGIEAGSSGSLARSPEFGTIARAAGESRSISKSLHCENNVQTKSPTGPSVWGFEPRLGVPRVITSPIRFLSAAWIPVAQVGSTAHLTARPPIEWATMTTLPGPPCAIEVWASQVMHRASCGPI